MEAALPDGSEEAAEIAGKADKAVEDDAGISINVFFIHIGAVIFEEGWTFALQPPTACRADTLEKAE